jgi:hypothetical protein
VKEISGAIIFIGQKGMFPKQIMTSFGFFPSHVSFWKSCVSILTCLCRFCDKELLSNESLPHLTKNAKNLSKNIYELVLTIVVEDLNFVCNYVLVTQVAVKETRLLALMSRALLLEGQYVPKPSCGFRTIQSSPSTLPNPGVLLRKFLAWIVQGIFRCHSLTNFTVEVGYFPALIYAKDGDFLSISLLVCKAVA